MITHRIKILFIINKMTYGGAGKMMAYLANRLSLDGYDIDLLTYEKYEIVPSLSARVHHIDFQYAPPQVYAFRRVLQTIKVRKVIREIQPDAILSFKTYPNIISILASTGTGIPVIISERGDPYANRSWFTIFRDIIYNFADGYVFQSNGAKNYYNKRIQEKSIVIPNPIVEDDIPTKWTGSKEDIIVNVGRFEIKQKRQDILIKAFAKIADKYKDLKLMLFGDGEDENKIIGIIAEYNLENRVILPGVTRDVYGSIKKAKLFVLSSDYEGIPNALIEAMAVGLPCITTDYSPGGAADLIKNMENGIIVKVGCINELINAMEFMLNNPGIAEIMGQNASKIIIELDPDLIINQWKNHINNHLSAKSDNK